MERPKFSVILPNYNHGHYLPICLQSIVDQSLPADEIVVVDDASSDNSVEVIKSFAAKCPAIRFYQNERNMGVNYTINRLFSLVTGDLVFGPASTITCCRASLRSRSNCCCNIRRRRCPAPSATGMKWPRAGTGRWASRWAANRVICRLNGSWSWSVRPSCTSRATRPSCAASSSRRIRPSCAGILTGSR